jgi:galactoside 2-L-fucosyltransferase 1/2
MEYNKHILCLYQGGGLGNNMFQYASMYAIAKSKGMRFVVPADFDLLNIFQLNATDIDHSGYLCDPKRVYTRPEKQCCALDKNLIDFDNTSVIRLIWNLASYYYFDKFSSDIRKQYTFVQHTQVKSQSLLNNIYNKHQITCREKVPLIGVHVRRGDYVNHPQGYDVATKEYLHRAVSWFQSRYSNIHFIAASNGMQWTKLNLPKNISVSYLEGNTPAVDMAVLSSCDHMISTVGTFSWWSAWLTGGNVTYYKWPTKEGTPIRQHFSKDYTDFFYPHWVGL